MIDKETFVKALLTFHDDLILFRAKLNSINTLPVPDRDTGDNMLATVSGLVQESYQILIQRERIIDPAIDATFGNSGMLIGAWLDGAERAIVIPTPIGVMATDAAVEVSRTIMDPIPGLFLDYAEAVAECLSLLELNNPAQLKHMLGEDLRILLVDTASRAPSLNQLVDGGSVGLYLFLRRLLGLTPDSADSNLFENMSPDFASSDHEGSELAEYLFSVSGISRPELTAILRELEMDSVMLGQTLSHTIRVHCHGSRHISEKLQDALAELGGVDQFFMREIYDRIDE